MQAPGSEDPASQKILGHENQTIQTLALCSDPSEMGILWAALIEGKGPFLECTSEVKAPNGKFDVKTLAIFKENEGQYQNFKLQFTKL